MLLAASHWAGYLAGLDGKNLLLLAIANVILFFSGGIIVAMQRKALEAGNPHGFVRSVMGGMTLKMVIFLAALIIYAGASGEPVNRTLVVISLILYLLYLIAEVYHVLQLNRRKHG